MNYNIIASYLAQFRAKNTLTPATTQHAIDIKDKSRSSVFAWKGQFSPQLIEHLLEQTNAKAILDPFCGSGTVLYEAASKNLSKATGIDINPAAITLASFSQYCSLSINERLMVIEESKKEIFSGLELIKESFINLDFCNTITPNIFNTCFLLNAFGDKIAIEEKKAITAFENISKKIIQLPQSKTLINIKQGDARSINIADKSIDIVITSPPYINVFNYHQNYRPIMEALGVLPLEIARAEIGANRKHRTNRLYTVIQYAIDMEDVFKEIWRTLDHHGIAIFVVGHSSKVRGIPFYNAEIISCLAELTGLFNLFEKHSRTFTNRFGEMITEDVLYFSKKNHHTANGESIGKYIGSYAILEALEKTHNPILREELEDAYQHRDIIKRSPYVI